MTSWFWNAEERRLRALWRILLQVVVMFVTVALPVVGISEAATWLLKSGRIPCSPQVFDKVMDILVGILMSGLVLLSLFVAGRWLDHRKFDDFGFRVNASWWKQYALGIALASQLMTLIFAAEFLAGWVDVIGYGHLSDPTLPWALAFIYPIIKALCVGVYEEAVHRGYHIINLKEGLVGVRGMTEKRAVVLAIILSLAFFGILHMRNPKASVMSTYNLVVIGALFGGAYVFTGQLAMCMGLHTAWNLYQGWVLGFPVSGDGEITNLIHIQQHGRIGSPAQPSDRRVAFWAWPLRLWAS